jgi:hypothetical protein
MNQSGVQKTLALTDTIIVIVVVVRLFAIKVFGKRRQSASALLLGLFLSLQAMAILPALHAWVHPDSSDPDHECAVTLLLHGQVDASSVAEPAFRAPECLIFNQAPPRTIFASVDIRLLPSRGPPASPALA